ncbi:hypothetical protein HPB48_018932 [Haemaphysalis longicornis]|uniref:Uncharacterized protein n=1 Tax=Haemaphysalis longicornis TaxID=44386 RepID=A0A9J6GU15_HAELO|nr:hypothetical protein HPB48_018932 [Haemaphysalis longicornis]
MGVATLLLPPRNHNLAPPDFCLFRKIKTTAEGTRHGTLEPVKVAARASLKEVPFDGFHGAFSDWVKRQQRRIHAGCE